MQVASLARQALSQQIQQEQREHRDVSSTSAKKLECFVPVRHRTDGQPGRTYRPIQKSTALRDRFTKSRWHAAIWVAATSFYTATISPICE